MHYKLTDPPDDAITRELWLQHAAGFMLFQDVRKYAIDLIDPDTDDKTKELILKGIDDTVYGLMMIMDGVTGSLKNEEYEVSIQSIISLKKNGEVIQEIDTSDSDGMCMGYHGWKEGDFGEDEPALLEQ